MSGQVEPDTYIVDKEGPRVLEVRIGSQAFEIVRGARRCRRAHRFQPR